MAVRGTTTREALVKEIHTDGGNTITFAGDIRDEAFARAMVDKAEALFGGLDIAFNNISLVGEMGPITEL